MELEIYRGIKITFERDLCGEKIDKVKMQPLTYCRYQQVGGAMTSRMGMCSLYKVDLDSPPGYQDVFESTFERCDLCHLAEEESGG